MYNTDKNIVVKLITEESPNISIMYRLPIEVYVYLPNTEEDFIKYENEITRDFVKIISGVNVIEFESFNLIPRRMVNMFISLCKIYSTNSEFPILINDIGNNYYSSQYIHDYSRLNSRLDSRLNSRLNSRLEIINTPIFTMHNEYKHITQENIGDSEIPKRFETNGNINREVLISDNNTNYIENYNYYFKSICS